jgi:dipeptidyl aminopeptidase/acylaminoacyl peptidase
VAFVVTRVDMAKNKIRTQVWVTAADGSRAPRPLTNGDKNDGQPVWSPCGNYLSFVSSRGEGKGEATLHVLPMGAPGELRTVATRKDGIGDARWSPDGRWIAFISRTPDARYAAEDESWQAPRKIERFLTRLNGEGWIFDRPAHVYVVPSDGTAEPRNLTPGEFEHGGVAWMSDSSAILTSAGRHQDWDRDLATDLYLVPLEGEIRALTQQTGSYSSAACSPDGTRIAVLGFDDPSTGPQNMHVGIITLESGVLRWVSRDLDRTFELTSGTRAPVWIDDDTLISAAEDRGECHLYRVSADGSSAPQRLTYGAQMLKSWDSNGTTTVVAFSTVDRPAELVACVGDTQIRLTNLSDAYVKAIRPRNWERFAVPTTDGTNEIDAWIMRPHDFDPQRTYGVLLNVHGGPHTQYGETFFDEAQIQATDGYVVLMCNPRGGSGREQSWGQAILGPKHPVAPGTGWGTVDVDDVLAVLDAALSRYSFCDADRVGMLGGSYGGYMATILAGRHGHRFKAICSERSVNNMLTEESNSDIATFFRVEHGPNHVDDPDEYTRLSPIRWVRDITVPMLLIHSEDDLRCPINQAEELFVALRLLKRDVTFYRFPGENHELSRGGSPIHRRQRAEIILDWFNEKMPAPAQSQDAVTA